MHAFLLIGGNSPKLKTKSEELAKKLQAKIMEYPLQIIDDARSLNNLIRLSFDKPTLIVSENIHEATEETLNAFLKNLEEPQQNIFFALTAPSVRKVLPTIVSRCQIIRIKSEDLRIMNEEAERFLDMTVGEKLKYIDKIRDREKAIELAENTVNLFHSQMHENKVKYSVVAKKITAALGALNRLKANGNVSLQLTNLVINLE